jgi:hypothetical protein
MTQRKGSHKNIDEASKNMTSRPCQRSWRTRGMGKVLEGGMGKFQSRGSSALRGVLLLFAN